MKDNFLMKKEWGPMIQALPSEKVGDLLKAIYLLDTNPNLELEDPILQGIFILMKGYINSNEKRYAEKCLKNSENARKKREERELEEIRADANEGDNIQLGTIVSERMQTKADDNEDVRNAPDKSYSLIIFNIISHLNIKAHKKFRTNSKIAREYIIARLNDGYTEEDMIRVIDNKVEEWLGDPKMERYLAPDTLFRPKHFERYLNEKPFDDAESTSQIKQSDPEDDEWADLTDEEWEAKMRALDSTSQGLEDMFPDRIEEE